MSQWCSTITNILPSPVRWIWGNSWIGAHACCPHMTRLICCLLYVLFPMQPGDRVAQLVRCWNSDLRVAGSIPSRVTLVCSWARQFNFTLPQFTQLWIWYLASCEHLGGYKTINRIPLPLLRGRMAMWLLQPKSAEKAARVAYSPGSWNGSKIEQACWGINVRVDLWTLIKWNKTINLTFILFRWYIV